MVEPTREVMFGVIEGFYGRPWSQAERFELFDWMSEWGLNTYVYAPKDDLKHRVLWRDTYTADECTTLRGLIAATRKHGLRFIFALGPGLDISYTEDLPTVIRRLDQLLELGCTSFALLFDDIPDQMDETDRAQFGSFASGQASIANEALETVRRKVPEAQFLFCPTPYCGRMTERNLGGSDYLETLGRELNPEIDVFWTGPEIISATIPLEHIAQVSKLLRRQPVIWDNLHANDYDGRRFFCGPYSGRALELRDAVGGILANPNNEFPLNYVPLRTLGEFARAETWDPRQRYLAGLQAWRDRFATIRNAADFEDLVLFADCFYLPHEDGAAAETLFQDIARAAAGQGPWPEAASRLRKFCTRTAELKDRELFYALSRRTWELREELDLLEKFVRTPDQRPFHSDFHLPGTYRGGFVPRLQRLLRQLPEGGFIRG